MRRPKFGSPLLYGCRQPPRVLTLSNFARLDVFHYMHLFYNIEWTVYMGGHKSLDDDRLREDEFWSIVTQQT